MKILISIFLLIFSFNLFACPNLSGRFEDEDGEIIHIDQRDCKKLHWKDDSNEVDLFADQVEREVERDGNNVVYGKASFNNLDFVLELRVVFASTPPSGYPTHFVTSYRLDKHNNLQEKIESVQGTSYITMKRVSFRH